MTACNRPGCRNTATHHVHGTSVDLDVCESDLTWAQKQAGVPRTTVALQDVDDGQETLFDLPAAPGRRAGLR